MSSSNTDLEFTLLGERIRREKLLPKVLTKWLKVVPMIVVLRVELIVLEVSYSNFARSFHVICWYRPPTACVNYAAFEELEKILKRLESDEKEIILIGNTNCDIKNNKNANSKNSNQSALNINSNN